MIRGLRSSRAPRAFLGLVQNRMNSGRGAGPYAQMIRGLRSLPPDYSNLTVQVVLLPCR
jgi:hypothetical protein